MTNVLINRLITEVDEVVGDNVEVTNDHIARMPFLSTLIKETLRYFSPVGMLIRETRQAVKSGGYLLPQGAFVAVSISIKTKK